VTQGEKFDPSGDFIRRWVPELAALDSKQLQRPAENPLLLARTKYPPPVVDHARQREKCLAMFKAVKGS
jgi:deoxyribodipyrimidine photo-lyase